MIIEFTFGNFRSFKDQATLSMVAASKLGSDTLLDAGNVFTVPEHPKLALLRVAAIYGANASGKSNIAMALYAFRRAVTQSANDGFTFEFDPFLLALSTQTSPMFFEMTFFYEEAQYRYGFEIQNVDEPVIVAEWLYRARSSKEAVLFERTEDVVERKRNFTEGAALLNKNKQLRRKGALFLSLAAQIGGEISSPIVAFIKSQIRVISGIEDKGLRQYTERCIEEGRYLSSTRQLLREADTGISNLHYFNEEEFRAACSADPEKNTEEANEALQRQIIRNMRIQTEHPVFDSEGRQVSTRNFPIPKFESQGTQKLFAFAGPIADTLEHGRLLFVDEMDAKFHPLLTKSLVSLFQSERTNPKNAQLIFITHDTNSLDNCRLRRDQMWFVEKDRYGASHLYSLAEFKGVRKGEFEGDYLAGRFGGIPLLGDMEEPFDQSKKEASALEITVHG